MATAKKRGRHWRCLVFSHYEYVDGKKIRKYKSFTASTKREAERLAAVWEYDRSREALDLTVRDAIEQYITIKSGVLSPSTERAYSSYLVNGRYDQISDQPVSGLDQRTLQAWVTSISRQYSAKYVRNLYALLRAALDMAGAPEITVTLPSGQSKEIYVPTDAELGSLLSYLDQPGKEELRAAVMLAAFGSLRRSEICGLYGSDFDGNVVTVQRAMVHDKDGQWVIKQPKTSTSYRSVVLPEQVVRLIDTTRERIVDTNPDALSNRFNRALRFSGISSKFSMHSLRHYYASIAHAIGIPDQYIMKMGGWKTDYVMKRNYRTTLSDLEKIEQDKLSEHFGCILVASGIDLPT